MTHKAKALDRNQAIADRFNAANPIGTMVKYWTFTRAGAPSGEARTRTAAQLLPSNVPAVGLEGVAGYIGLPHVQVIRGRAE